MFMLHPRLVQDSFFIGDFPLTRLLIQKDANFPWFILVPRRERITEIFQLAPSERQQLMTESCWLAETMQKIYQPDKLNIAALGNQVPQLHLHHIARFQDDAVWPKPVWGAVNPLKYDQKELHFRVEVMIRALLNYDFEPNDRLGKPMEP